MKRLHFAGSLCGITHQIDPNWRAFEAILSISTTVSSLRGGSSESPVISSSVAQLLSATYGVLAARLRAIGDEPSAPVASNDSEEGRAKNRRVELVKQ